MRARGLLPILVCLHAPAAMLPAPAAEPAGPPVRPWFRKAPPLPPPGGDAIRVSSVEHLFRAVAEAKPGGTILLADGHYWMPRFLDIRTDGVTLRGASGDRDRVVLDGARSRHGELVGVTRSTGVTIADLTIQNIRWNGFKLNSDSGISKVTIRNCVIRNIWQRGIKGVAVPRTGGIEPPADCRVEYCLFYNDRPKQFSDDPADTPQNFDGNYIGGIDVMYPKRWTIRDNVFIGIRGRGGAGRGAVFLWHEAEDNIVERNVIIDCDSGICLGNSHRPEHVALHARRCIVRNNFVTRCPENGILADYTEDSRILHNTIHDPGSRLGRLIRLVHANDGLVVAGNLLSGPALRNETQSRVVIRGNFTGDATAAFAGAGDGDLHLAKVLEGVVDAAEASPDVKEDLDGRPRGPRPDIGADEREAP